MKVRMIKPYAPAASSYSRKRITLEGERQESDEARVRGEPKIGQSEVKINGFRSLCLRTSRISWYYKTGIKKMS